jgi:succinate dehydrogenase / fumarate reductase, cytochrome b subunit
VRKQRPINLDLLTIKFPLPAIVSILHRISGFFVFLLIPLLLWMLSASLSSPGGFEYIQEITNSPLTKFILWLFLSALIYHLIAGIRHLLMDMGWGESLKGGILTSKIVMALSLIMALLIGGWLW